MMMDGTPDQFTLDSVSQLDRVWAVFQSRGGALTYPEWAQSCWDAGLFSENQLKQITLQGIIRICRHAAKEHDQHGIIRAAVINKFGIVKMRQLWLFAEYGHATLERIEQSRRVVKMAVKLIEECRVKFGRVPLIAGFNETDPDAAPWKDGEDEPH